MSDDATRKVTWVAQPAHGLACRVDAVHGELACADCSGEALLCSVAALARSTLLLPSHAQVDVCAFVHRADGSIERAIIGVV